MSETQKKEKAHGAPGHHENHGHHSQGMRPEGISPQAWERKLRERRLNAPLGPSLADTERARLSPQVIAFLGKERAAMLQVVDVFETQAAERGADKDLAGPDLMPKHVSMVVGPVVAALGKYGAEAIEKAAGLEGAITEGAVLGEADLAVGEGLIEGMAGEGAAASAVGKLAKTGLKALGGKISLGLAGCVGLATTIGATLEKIHGDNVKRFDKAAAHTIAQQMRAGIGQALDNYTAWAASPDADPAEMRALMSTPPFQAEPILRIMESQLAARLGDGPGVTREEAKNAKGHVESNVTGDLKAIADRQAP